MNNKCAVIAERGLPRYHKIMKNSRIIAVATCCALAARAWGNAGLTSAGVDPTVGNNAAQNEPTLAQVAPVANQGQPGANAGTSAGVVLPATGAGAQGAAAANAQHPANGAAPDASKTAATAAAAAPAPPPPPPDPSTLPVSVIRPLNKAPESAPPPPADTVSPVASKTKPTRQPPANAPAEPKATPAPPRVTPPAPVRTDTARSTADTAAKPSAAATSATADGSENGYVFYTGVGIAAIILALSFFGFMRAGNSDSGRPRA